MDILIIEKVVVFSDNEELVDGFYFLLIFLDCDVFFIYFLVFFVDFFNIVFVFRVVCSMILFNIVGF